MERPALLLCLVLGAFDLWVGTNPSASVLLYAYLIAIVVLEARAVVVPGYGLFSLAFPVYLAVALTEGVGLRAAVLFLVGGVLLKSVLHGGPKLRDILVDLLPGLMALTLSGPPAQILFSEPGLLARTFLALGLYCPLMLWLPGQLAGEVDPEQESFIRLNLFPFQAGAGLLAPVIATSMETQPWLALATLPILMSGVRFGRFITSEVETLTRRLLKQRQQAAEKQAEKLGNALNVTQRTLSEKYEERALLDQLAAELARGPGLEATIEMGVTMAQRVVRCDSAVIFLEEGEKLVPKGWKSRHREKLEGFELLDTHEPIVLQCWKERKVLLTKPNHLAGARLFTDEQSAVALPLFRVGVLYCGKIQRERFERAELNLLALLADQIVPALVSARRSEELGTALSSQAVANQNLSLWNERLAAMLAASGELAATLDPAALLGRLQRLARGLVPHHEAGCIALVGDERKLRLHWPDSVRWGPALEGLLQAASSQGCPLLFEDVQTSRFGQPTAGARGVLVVPILSEDRVEGIITLASPKPNSFSRNDQDVLMTLAYHAAAVLTNSRLYQQVLTTNQELEESQAQLVQSSKMAAIGQLAAGVAHEINSPLAAILLAVQSVRLNIKKGNLDPADKKLAVAEEAAKGAREIISKLLVYSRRAPSEQQTVDPNQVLSDTLALIGPQVVKLGVRLEKRLSEVPLVRANRTELQQVLTNLIINAKDAVLLPEASDTLVTVFSRFDGEKVLLEVVDTGPGVSPELQDRIFDPFFTTKDVGQGTGLGLSVSLELVERNGGNLSLRSQVGRGATFSIALPPYVEEEGELLE
ncbi:MAG: GAF domain-containing protein [Candidatus Eremiobacteraeota bacterium]|nr:GAF domain-containing protein [Candidatus Eremiobacteraeota bacterium]